jgi:uncharacterized membrane protein SpoIIM required for sporulation
LSALKLKSSEFRREREHDWRALEQLLSRVDEVGVRRLNARELAQLPRLHRAALSSLSVARAISLDRNLAGYLEALAARSHFAVYGSREHLRDAVTGFILRDFPRAVRTFRWHVCLAALFLAAGVATSAMLTHAQPERFYAFIDAAQAQGRDPAASTQELRDALYAGPGEANDQLTTFASFLFTHNAQIAILAFALGFVAGLPVFVLLFSNGLSLGALAELHRQRGLAVDFWGWILPHGITELLAVILCGAAGLVIAEAIVFPGALSRLDNLSLRGKQAAKVVLGAVCMLFLAGLVEGIFRQRVQSVPIRYAVAGTTAVLWSVYFGWRR